MMEPNCAAAKETLPRQQEKTKRRTAKCRGRSSYAIFLVGSCPPGPLFDSFHRPFYNTGFCPGQRFCPRRAWLAESGPLLLSSQSRLAVVRAPLKVITASAESAPLPSSKLCDRFVAAGMCGIRKFPPEAPGPRTQRSHRDGIHPVRCDGRMSAPTHDVLDRSNVTDGRVADTGPCNDPAEICRTCGE